MTQKQSPSSWYHGAATGDMMVYHSSCCLALTGGGAAVREIRDMYDRGEIDLVQRRNGLKFDYIAVKRRKPAKIALENTFRWMEERF